MKKSGAFFSIQKSQIFPSTPNTDKKTSFGPLLTDIFFISTIKVNTLMANGPFLAHIFGKKFKINETTLCILLVRVVFYAIR